MRSPALRFARSPQLNNPLPYGCVLYLPFWHEELRGTVFNSVDDFRHIATVTGGVFGYQGWTVDGDDKITVPDANSLDFGTGDFTLSAWIKTSQGSDNNISIIQKIELVGSDYFGYALDVHTAKVALTMPDGDATIPVYSASNTINNGTWRLCSVSVLRSTGHARFYLNGTSDGVGDISGNTATTTNAASLLLARAEFYSKYFIGTIGEVIVHKRALTAAEQLHIYNTTKWRYTG